ncbi:MAG: SRPBCC family protein [Tomitella sp.]|nr:SRPBCC family protein [Tomitella sp.]
MAVSAHTEIEIAAPPAEVMKALADVEALPQWSAQHKSAVIEDRYDDGLPKRVRTTISVMGISDEMLVEYTWDGDAEVSWTLIESSQQKSQLGRYTLTPTDKGTKAEFYLEVDLKIAVPGFIVKKGQKAGVETATKGLKQYVEKG